ncbi:hypothetical protein C481_12474 [Natrialba asiatica DSM 12278]|uniref:DUF5518 domain-containing protein n=1 Tax=Natrialba asiatica (strain ATCC 700177 / DSM 12278 / JCM 9576 / FERM P-10747 / NBRC 102637 / 172P1) TaxID=29540 RepID=M0ARA0_NATA1|nr:hypothetical protein C481_12474 [Natrialba asiatica DSM 12278]
MLGFISGMIYMGSDASVAVLHWGTIGILGGLTAGYIAGENMGSGALHGGIATVFGSLILLAIAAFTTLLFAGVVPMFSVVVLGLLMLAFYAIPGVLGGAIGSWAKGRRTATEMVGTRA